MDDTFIVKPLGQRQIDQAYPLVRAIAPDLAVERWRAFAASHIGTEDSPIGSATGIMTVQNGRGYIHGLFSYAIEEHLRHGRILAVENFVVLDLFDPSGAAEILVHSMETQARALGCSAIHTTLPATYAERRQSERSVLSCFRNEGHQPEKLRLCKALDRANDNRRSSLPDPATETRGEC